MSYCKCNCAVRFSSLLFFNINIQKEYPWWSDIKLYNSILTKSFRKYQFEKSKVLTINAIVKYITRNYER